MTELKFTFVCENGEGGQKVSLARPAAEVARTDIYTAMTAIAALAVKNAINTYGLCDCAGCKRWLLRLQAADAALGDGVTVVTEKRTPMRAGVH